MLLSYMTHRNLLLAFILSCALCGAAEAGDFDGVEGNMREALIQSRSGGDAGIVPALEVMPGNQKSGGAPVKDDLKESVLRHLDKSIAYCDKHMDDCNGANNSIRDFAKGIGGGRCNNRGFNCVNEVLEMCKQQAEEGEITPMYYMACGSMLGKLGERDCAEGRASCAGYLQGSIYFSLRAAAGCHKSFEKNKEKLAVADRNVDRFAAAVKQNVKGLYVGKVEEAQTVGHHLAWHTGKEAGIIGTEKILEFAFERLAWHSAGAVVGSVGAPLFVFSTFMLFHEIAASEMNNLVCLEWGHYYKGSYANSSASIARMSGFIK